MSKSIDERVVDMQFNNKQFETGVQTSIKSLDQLKQGLNLEASAKSLSSLDKVGRAFSLAGISQGVETISNKFTALGIIGVTALQNITNSAINTGKRILSALTIDPIKTGLQEYETKMGAIQTILTNTASKGSTLADVNKILGELNEYSDKTIYNFAEMARNIGTFTAAGIGLETSATAIKGIANLAAGSGSTSQQASTAMYQLSQALAGGAVKLMDWNSVVNAGMGGELFQNALKDTAKQMGIVVNESVPFRESLQEGWITADVLTKTLERFAEDESLVKAATEVKTLTQMYDTMKETVQSGWAVSWENIIGDKAQSTELLTSISEAFGALMGPATDARNEMLSFWNVNGGRDAMIEAITNAFKGLQSIMAPITSAFREVFPAMTGQRLVEISKSIRDLTKNFKMGEDTVNAIKTTFKGLFSLLDLGGQVVVTLVKSVAELLGNITPLGTGILGVASSFGEFLTSINDSARASGIFNTILEKLTNILKPIPNMFSGFDNVGSIFENLSTTIGRAFSAIQEHISNAIGNFNFDKFFTILNGGLIASLILGFKKFVGSLTNVIDEGGGFIKSAKSIFTGISGILDGVRGSLEAYQNQLKAGTLLKIATAIGILAASLFVLSTIEPEKLTSALTGITILFAELIGSIAMIGKLGGIGIKNTLTIIPMMLALSASLLILSGAMKILSTLDWNGIAKGLISIGVLMGELIAFMKIADASKMSIRSAVGISILAGALITLSLAVAMLGRMDIKKLAKGLISIGILLGELLLFIKLSGNPVGLISTAIGLTILSTALLIFSAAVGAMGSMSMETLAKGLGALAISLTLMGIAMYAMQTGLPGAAALLVMAGAIAILVPALMLLGSMSLSNIGTSLLALAGILVIFGLTAVVLAPLAPALLAVSVALALFGVAVLAIGAGVLALSIGLTGLSVAGAAGATALVAIVTSLISVIPFMMRKFGEGIVELAVVIGENAPTLIEAVFKLITSFLDCLVENIPKIVEKGADMLIGLIKGITSKVPQLVQAGFDLIITFLNALADSIRVNAPLVLNAVTNLMLAIITTSVNALKGGVSAFIEAGKNLINGFIDGIKSKIQEAAQMAANLARAALNAAKAALGINSPSKEFAKIGMYADEGFANGLRQFSGMVTTSAEDLGNSAIHALKSTISKISDVIESNIDSSPVIRPVIDLSNIKAGGDKISQLFNQNRGLNLDIANRKIPNMEKPVSSNVPRQSETPGQESKISFVQNNYSPKTLSRLDIYRQTRNQISTMKGLAVV